MGTARAGVQAQVQAQTGRTKLGAALLEAGHMPADTVAVPGHTDSSGERTAYSAVEAAPVPVHAARPAVDARLRDSAAKDVEAESRVAGS